MIDLTHIQHAGQHATAMEVMHIGHFTCQNKH